METICQIQQVFVITSRGCVILPGIPEALAARVQIGSRVVVQTPEGRRIEATVGGIEKVNRSGPTGFSPFLLQEPITKADLPIGSQICLP